jgi:DNA-binding IscR family transcriptional regulator
MQLTRFTDFGLRVLMNLAHQPPGQLATRRLSDQIIVER